jgi:chaperone modulatory protein CbpM
MTVTGYALVVQRSETLAREAGIDPDLARRFVAFGLIDGAGPAAAARLARAARLRRDLGLNCAGAVLASELLDRIDELQARLHHYETSPWTRAS